MITIRRSDERGRVNIGWLNARHSFSFGNYHDPKHMGFGDLRVINQDIIAGGGGFGEHGHRDMEILTYVLRGALAHRDSLGNKGQIRPGEMQRMSAGSGILHSEMNASYDEECELLQIWILPAAPGIAPGYEQRPVPDGSGLVTLASPEGDGGAVTIHQDARVLLGRLARGEAAEHELGAGRGAWIQMTKGTVEIGGETLSPGDAAAITNAARAEVRALAESEFLLFDVRA